MTRGVTVVLPGRCDRPEAEGTQGPERQGALSRASRWVFRGASSVWKRIVLVFNDLSLFRPTCTVPASRWLPAADSLLWGVWLCRALRFGASTLTLSLSLPLNVAPSRPTSPEKFSVPHVCARFGPGGQLIKVVPNLPSEGQPALVEVHSMEVKPPVHPVPCICHPPFVLRHL